MTPDPLNLALRVYPEPRSEKSRRKRGRLAHWPRSRWMLVFDTETRVDAAQALTRARIAVGSPACG
jgi:hypothetical protein